MSTRNLTPIPTTEASNLRFNRSIGSIEIIGLDGPWIQRTTNGPTSYIMSLVRFMDMESDERHYNIVTDGDSLYQAYDGRIIEPTFMITPDSKQKLLDTIKQSLGVI